MNNNATQKIWQELQEKLLCCRCKSGKLLIWEKPDYGDISHASKHQNNQHYYAIKCEYFKTTIQNSLELKRCAASQPADRN